MNKIVFLTCLSCLLMIFSLNAQADPNLIVNGSFEESVGIAPMLNVPAGSTEITGWVVTPEPIDYLDSTSSDPSLVWQASDGSRSLDLAGSYGMGPMGGIAQSFSTDVGIPYLVTFDMAGNPSGYGWPTIKSMRVIAANQFADFTFDTTGHNENNMGWEGNSWIFTAIDSTTTLEFQNTTYTNLPGYDPSYGAALDNVRVSVAPEPISSILFVTGGSLLAGRRFIRRKV